MSIFTGDAPAAPADPPRRRAPKDRALGQSFFGRIELYGGRHIIMVPEDLVTDQGLHSGDTVEVRVENLAITV